MEVCAAQQVNKATSRDKQNIQDIKEMEKNTSLAFMAFYVSSVIITFTVNLNNKILISFAHSSYLLLMCEHSPGIKSE